MKRAARPRGARDAPGRAGPIEGLADLAAAHALSDGQAAAIGRLLNALADEPDPGTTMRTRAAALQGHVADSLAGLAVPQLRAAGGIADLGAGVGFPGLALAVALPEATVDLVESSSRHCAVIERLSAAAQLSNARVRCGRAEDLVNEGGRGAFDAVTGRAVAALPVLVEYAAPLLTLGGVLVAWKGARSPDEERAGQVAAERLGLAAIDVRGVVPFQGAHSRHLHVYSKVAETPSGFPRRAGMAVKRPLG